MISENLLQMLTYIKELNKYFIVLKYQIDANIYQNDLLFKKNNKI